METKQKYQCVNCNTNLEYEDISYSDTGDSYCQECYEETFTMCTLCNSEILIEDTISHDNELMCEFCFNDSYFHCHACHEIERIDYEYYSEITDRTYCGDCYCELFDRCQDCGCEVSRDYICYDERRDIHLCPDCYQDRNGLYDSSYKPNPLKFLHTSKEIKSKTLFYGIELEIDLDEDISFPDYIEQQSSMENFPFYYKHECSVSSGCEVTHHPMSFNYIKQTKIWDKQIDLLRSDNFVSFNSSNSCGVHIHISKNMVSRLQLYKMLRFFSKNKDKIIKLAQRNSGNFATFDYYDHSSQINRNYFIQKAKLKSNVGKFFAINCGKRDTIEFRIFKGTLNKVSFNSYIEFVDSLYYYTLTHSLDSSTYDFDTYFNYVSKKPKRYANLIKKIEKYQLIKYMEWQQAYKRLLEENRDYLADNEIESINRIINNARERSNESLLSHYDNYKNLAKKRYKESIKFLNFGITLLDCSPFFENRFQYSTISYLDKNYHYLSEYEKSTILSIVKSSNVIVQDIEYLNRDLHNRIEARKKLRTMETKLLCA